MSYEQLRCSLPLVARQGQGVAQGDTRLGPQDDSAAVQGNGVDRSTGQSKGRRRPPNAGWQITGRLGSVPFDQRRSPTDFRWMASRRLPEYDGALVHLNYA